MKKKILLLGITALACLSLASCGDDDQSFDQTSATGSGISMYIIGSHWNNWTTDTIKEASDPSCTFTKNSSGYFEYTATVTTEMASGLWGFKFIASNSWSDQYGIEDVDFANCNQAFKDVVGADTETFTGSTTNRGNITKSSSYAGTGVGTYKIVYDPTNFDSETREVTVRTQKTDADGNPVVDADGNPVYIESQVEVTYTSKFSITYTAAE